MNCDATALLVVVYALCGALVALDYHLLSGERPAILHRVWAGVLWPLVWVRASCYYWGDGE